jgi:hypothetical protein
MNKFVVMIGVVLVVATAGFVYVAVTTPEAPTEIVYSDETFVFINDAGESVSIQYDETAKSALVKYAENEYRLTRDETSTGTRYESGNGLVVFTEQDGEARLGIDDQTVIVGVLQDLEPGDDAPTDQASDDLVLADQGSSEGDMSAGEVTVATDAEGDVETAAQTDGVPVASVPVLGQRCVDGPTVDCAALKAAARAR